jgi:hypothetical protein
MVTTPTGVAPPPPDAGTQGTLLVDPDDRVFQPMSLRGPALAVLGLAVLIVVAGVVGSAIGSGSAPRLADRTVTIPDGTIVHLMPAQQALRPIVTAGEPPADILGALAVPAGSTVTGTVDTDQNATQFDRTVVFRTGLASGQVVDVYRTLLPKLGWQVTYVGPGYSRQAAGTEVLAKKGSGDSFYWEAGVVVSPTTSAGTTRFSLEVFELPDDQ